MQLDQIARLAEAAQDEVAEIASRLVQFNTAHPEGRTDHIVQYIKGYFDAHGILCEIHAHDPLKPNIVAHILGASERTILWLGHIDVVPAGKPDLWSHPPFEGVIEQGKVFGRGSSDMKGACAAAMVAARILSELDQPLPHNLAFWFTSDEEIGGREGARWLAETGRMRGDFCLVGDGSCGGMAYPSLDLGCKGSVRPTLIARGHTAHGSTPFLGVNALKQLMRAMPAVERIAEFKLDLPDELAGPVRDSIAAFKASQQLSPEQEAAADRLYDYPTVTPNVLHAGEADNLVPDYAEVVFDIRLTPGSDPQAVKAELERLVAKAGVPGVEIQVEAGTAAGYYVSPNLPGAQQLAHVVEAFTGKEPLFKILTGGSDGISVDRYLGIPAVGYGASLTGMAHQPDEHITVENLVLATKVYAWFPFVYEAEPKR